MSKQKKIVFTLEFEKPELGDGLSVRCPVCKADPGVRCHTQVWKRGPGMKPEGGNKMSDLHHDRWALVMNLEVVRSGQLYRIKG